MMGEGPGFYPRVSSEVKINITSVAIQLEEMYVAD